MPSANPVSKFFRRVNDMSNIMITAHSGCEGTPDNSMASILTGMALGADCVEVDVRMDADRRLWLTHDPQPDYSRAVPLKDALLAVADSNICINCDLKEYGALLPALQLARACGIPPARLLFSGSVDIRMLTQDASIARHARIFLNSEELCRYLSPGASITRPEQTAFLLRHVAGIASCMRELHAECLNAPYAFMSAADIASLRAHGIALSLWTVNDAQDQLRLLREDLLNITTRNVRSALALRAAANMNQQGD